MGRRGPEQEYVKDDDRSPIVGLIVRKDGRFAAKQEDGKYKTFGTDRAQAIRRFYEWQNRDKFDPFAARSDLASLTSEDLYWLRVKTDLTERPKFVAKMTGFEQIAYLDKLKPSPPSATLKSIIDRFSEDKEGEIEYNGIRNSQTWWQEFADITGAKVVSDLSLESFRLYRKTIKDRKGDRADAWVRSRFGQVNTVINHALKEMDLSSQDRETFLYKSLLVKPPQAMGDPKCLEVDELKAILDKADEFDTALILLALNAAYYPVDCHRLTWDKIDFKTKSITRFPRIKSQKKKSRPIPRSVVLWDRTIFGVEQT